MLGRDNQFWDYHKGELIRAGVGFNRVRLTQGVLATLNDAALNPKHTLRRSARQTQVASCASHAGYFAQAEREQPKGR